MDRRFPFLMVAQSATRALPIAPVLGHLVFNYPDRIESNFHRWRRERTPPMIRLSDSMWAASHSERSLAGE